MSVFIKGDWDRHSVTLFNDFVTGPILFLCLLAIFGYWQLLVWSAAVLSSYDLGLCLSMLVYRYFFHPLRHFPGPRRARISSLWSIPDAVIKAKWHIRVQQLHGQYGELVRIRPREISINDASAVNEIYGVAARCNKGPFYDLNYPHRSLQMSRSRVYHSKRRKIWDRAFTSQALAGYEPRILEHCQILLDIISSSEEKALEVTNLIGDFSWDSMGILTFGKSFDMLSGTSHELLMRRKAMGRAASLIVWAPWPIVLFRKLPADLSHDLFSYLIGDSRSGSSHAGKVIDQDLVFDTELAVVAGSDTAASSLNSIIFFLAKNPAVLEELRKEIDSVVSSQQVLSHAALIGKPYLEGCIYEGLRLWPAVLSGVPRETGPKGETIGGVHIPPFTTVVVPTYTMHRDLRNFREPDEFLPERWSNRPEMVIRKEAFIPFSSGPYSCAGRNFAMMEMRLLLAVIVRGFDFEFPPAEENQSFDTLGGTGPLDCFTTHVPCYRLVFKKRRHN